MQVTWESSFIAVSIALGETAESASVVLADPNPAKELLAALAAADRKTRAKALASALAPVVMDLERAEVTWA